jgi:hypothetical protein
VTEEEKGLIDVFACAALAGFLAKDGNLAFTRDTTNCAYRIAVWMVKARQQAFEALHD